MRPFTASDRAALVRWIDSARTLFNWTGMEMPLPLDEDELEHRIGGRRRGERFRLMAETSAGPIGYVELDDVRRGQGSGYMRRAIVDPRQRGGGVGAEMVARVLARAFEDLGLHRVGVTVYDWNPVALACYQGVGFVQEGRLRDANRFRGEYRDLLVMSMLAPEWTGRHAA